MSGIKSEDFVDSNYSVLQIVFLLLKYTLTIDISAITGWDIYQGDARYFTRFIFWYCLFSRLIFRKLPLSLFIFIYLITSL